MSYSFSITMPASPPPIAPPADPLERGISAHRAGNLDEAWAFYLEAARARPDRALAVYHLGLVQIGRGLGLSSVPFLLRAATLYPQDPDFCQSVLYARLRAGRVADCADLLVRYEEQGVAVNGELWREWLQQCRDGTAPASLPLREPGLLDPSTKSEPADSAAPLPTETSDHALLTEPFARALEVHRQGRAQDLVDELGAVLEQHPRWGEGHHLRGLGLFALDRFDAAADTLRRATALLPGRAEVWDHLGIVLNRMEDRPGFINAYEQSLALNPLRHESWNNAANAMLGAEQFDEGYQYAETALRLNPTTDTRHEIFNLGRAAQGLGDLGLARRAFERLLGKDPGYVGAEFQLGMLCLEVGEQERAIAHFTRVLEMDPDNDEAHSRLIFLNNYLGTETSASLHQRASRYAALLTRRASPLNQWPNPPNPRRRLRVGFVSGDLRSHSVGFFFQSVVEALGRIPGLELFAYPTSAESDSLTDRLRAALPHWRLLARVNDAEACREIMADQIDILVDLSGHTKGHRLGIFARKPAPVQVSWLGYFGTTGLSQIDYLLAGPWDVPPAEATHFSESVWRLPHTRLCFSRPPVDVPVAPLPAARSGHMTFACFNDVRKISDQVVRLWAKILLAVDGSQLFLKSPQLRNEAFREATAERFGAAGLGADRLLMEGRSPFDEYMRAYNGVDIVLDPFPYTGGTTTAQALWMGVPVLTLAGHGLGR